VLKIDLATHEAIEIVGEISDKDVKRAERLCGQRRGTTEARMDEDSWQRVTLRPRTVNDTHKPVRKDKHAQKTRRRSWMLATMRTLTPLI